MHISEGVLSGPVLVAGAAVALTGTASGGAVTSSALTTKANSQAELELIRGAIDDINAALQQDPDNTLLQELLMKTYHEELNVMRKVGGVTQSVMSRRDI